jgi:hypothetical protein
MKQLMKHTFLKTWKLGRTYEARNNYIHFFSPCGAAETLVWGFPSSPHWPRCSCNMTLPSYPCFRENRRCTRYEKNCSDGNFVGCGITARYSYTTRRCRKAVVSTNYFARAWKTKRRAFPTLLVLAFDCICRPGVRSTLFTETEHSSSPGNLKQKKEKKKKVKRQVRKNL